ncbi:MULTISPECIES: phosphogluconate dehydrogenase (NAD(+)-dependent, decarboxylating) [unclassified Spirosoma]|mgnify:CR=1 FL=1|uniref:phosphogluconate dehydrogenase (NAD(+)-dependent, decarboxylating) n=1 Tax=unclassified Spirosoma TaxID=2621999 RepID=UPI0009694A67|nr:MULTISPECIES: decarboxylating 6-phosphogluconate dehydrogenase [unclassified Spirosoma]MBN8824231.1 decarboxylating 6-phosphogluconate dehydrogenase [Spirosoma sp.]OJW78963.1 MAG: 6-phosphogluconate dehydrogenase (decarboxylating) [Spirosoma sp. 48-14]
MHIGFIGLGKMGYNLVSNLVRHGHTVVGYDINEALVEAVKKEGAQGASSLQDMYNSLPEKRVLWLMIPAGALIDKVIEQLLQVMNPGDVVIDGGNSHYKDSIRRHEYLKQKGIGFLDCGTSGGMSGALNGACTMVGGDPDVIEPLHTVFKDISVEDGYLYTGPAGSGHFTKMVHNGIEYGMMQSIAEGFEVLSKSPFPMDYQAVAKMWNHGSVIRSWLMELTEDAFKNDPNLDSIKGKMFSSGEGKWTLETALDLEVPTPVIALSLLMRYRSLQEDTFTGKVVAALRNEFGGHAVEKK